MLERGTKRFKPKFERKLLDEIELPERFREQFRLGGLIQRVAGGVSSHFFFFLSSENFFEKMRSFNFFEEIF